MRHPSGQNRYIPTEHLVLISHVKYKIWTVYLCLLSPDNTAVESYTVDTSPRHRTHSTHIRKHIQSVQHPSTPRISLPLAQIIPRARLGTRQRPRRRGHVRSPTARSIASASPCQSLSQIQGKKSTAPRFCKFARGSHPSRWDFRHRVMVRRGSAQLDQVQDAARTWAFALGRGSHGSVFQCSMPGDMLSSR